MLWVQLYPHTEYITELTSGPVTCSAKHNKHAYSFHCFTPQPPINKHSGPEDTMYVNHSGASVKWWHFSPHFLNQTPWMKSGSSGFPDNTNCPEKKKNWGLLPYPEKKRKLFSTSSDSSDPWFEVVTDFHYLHFQRHKAQDEKWWNSLFEMMTAGKWCSVTFSPPTETHWYSQNGVITLVLVPFDKTQLLPLKMTGLLYS